MSVPFYTNVDLAKNQLLNVLFQILPSAPSNPSEGQFYYNSTDKTFYYYNGTTWVTSQASLPEGVVIDNNYVHTDNNFTTQLLNKLNGLENNAQVNKIEIIKVNNSNLEIQNKSVNINVPTKLSDLQNDMNFITSSDSITGNAATATKLQNSVKINGVTFDGTQDIDIDISGVDNAVSYKNTNNLVANLPTDL